MVELRKRPAPKETATAAPAAKRSASKPRVSAKAKASNVSKQKTVETKAEAEADANTKTNVAADSGDAAVQKEKPKDVRADDKADEKPAAESSKGAATTTNKQFPLGTSSQGTTISLQPLLTTPITLHISSTSSSSSSTKTFADLYDSSKSGLIIFSYPRASTPGCTTQACLFRDSYTQLSTTAGYSVFGLSNDSPKSNANFVAKKNLPYDLICDQKGELSALLGLKKAGNALGCSRGVVLLKKQGGGGGGGGGDDDDKKALVGVWLLGGPQKTLDVCLDFIDGKS